MEAGRRGRQRMEDERGCGKEIWTRGWGGGRTVRTEARMANWGGRANVGQWGELKDGSRAGSHQLNGCDLSLPGTAAGAGLPPDLWAHLVHTEGHTQAFLLYMWCAFPVCLFLCMWVTYTLCACLSPVMNMHSEIFCVCITPVGQKWWMCKIALRDTCLAPEGEISGSEA